MRVAIFIIRIVFSAHKTRRTKLPAHSTHTCPHPRYRCAADANVTQFTFNYDVAVYLKRIVSSHFHTSKVLISFSPIAVIIWSLEASRSELHTDSRSHTPNTIPGEFSQQSKALIFAAAAACVHGRMDGTVLHKFIEERQAKILLCTKENRFD